MVFAGAGQVICSQPSRKLLPDETNQDDETKRPRVEYPGPYGLLPVADALATDRDFRDRLESDESRTRIDRVESNDVTQLVEGYLSLLRSFPDRAFIRRPTFSDNSLVHEFSVLIASWGGRLLGHFHIFCLPGRQHYPLTSHCRQFVRNPTCAGIFLHEDYSRRSRHSVA